MYVIRFSIDDFIDRAVLASEGSDYYPGMLVVAARAADAQDLHDHLIANWRDLDDLTADAFIFAVPSSPDQAEMPQGTDFSRGLVAEGLHWGPQQMPPEWSRRFWAVKQVTPQRPDEPMTRAYAPPTEEAARAGLTSSATRLARYFGLSEAELPCVVLLSFWDRQLFVIRASPPLDLYRLVKAVIISYQGVARVRAAEEALTDARGAARETARNREHGTRFATVVEQWEAQRQGSLRPLRHLAELKPEIAPSVGRLIDRIEANAVPSADDDTHVAAVLGFMDSHADELRPTGVNRLSVRLPRIMAKLRTLTPVTSANESLEALRDADRRANELVARLAEDLEAARRDCAISLAVRAATAEEGLVVKQQARGWRGGWTVQTVTHEFEPAFGSSRE